MRVQIHTVSNINADQIIRKKGLEPNGRMQRFLIGDCDRHMTDYLPFRTGAWMKTRHLLGDGILYQGPQSTFLYYGKLMVGVESGSPFARKYEQKRVTNRNLKYCRDRNPLAGPYWDKRMWKDKKEEILNDIARECSK